MRHNDQLSVNANGRALNISSLVILSVIMITYLPLVLVLFWKHVLVVLLCAYGAMLCCYNPHYFHLLFLIRLITVFKTCHCD